MYYLIYDIFNLQWVYQDVTWLLVKDDLYLFNSEIWERPGLSIYKS